MRARGTPTPAEQARFMRLAARLFADPEAKLTPKETALVEKMLHIFRTVYEARSDKLALESKRRRGRPTSLTPAVQRAIVESLRAGVYVQTAATIAGVSKQSFYGWCQRGKAGEQPYKEFLDACEKAISEAEASAVKSIRAAGQKNWQALCWWLERRHRQRWARNVDLGTQMQISQPAGAGPVVVVTGPAELPATDETKNG